MSSVQLWSNSTTCNYKKEDSALEAKLVSFENLKKTKIFLGSPGIKISNICFCFVYSKLKKMIGLCWRTRPSHGVSETGEGHLRHRRKRTRFHKSLVFHLWLLHCLNWIQAIRFPKKEAILVVEVVLLFADNTLIMCDIDDNQILNLDHIFLCFETISELKVNLQKSELVAVGEVLYIEELASILCYNISPLPLRYLGLPLGDLFKSKAIWDGVVKKIEKKGWLVGRSLTLIKSTLSSIPTYFLSLFPLPAGIARRLERLQRDRLWECLGKEPKMHLVN